MYQLESINQIDNSALPHPVSNLRILSYNIQSGLPGQNFREYLKGSWRHVLPNTLRTQNLEQIAGILQDYDLVALQEVDAGSLRTGFVNQVQYLAHEGGFPHWFLQVNRNLGKLAKYANAVLSRIKPYDSTNYKLPGMIPGRGAIRLLFGDPKNPLVLIIMHLALGPVARRLQLEYIAELIHGYEHVILMGDMNCQWKKLVKSSLLKNYPLRSVNYSHNTYPSWRPRRNIDHILISPSVKIEKVAVLNVPFSDHLPIALEISLPRNML